MIDTKKIYSDWLDYCQLCVEEMTDLDEAHSEAEKSKYNIYHGRAWDLVCSVREWEPDLFEDVEHEEPNHRTNCKSPTEIVTWMAFTMTLTKIQTFVHAKEEEDA